MYTTYNVYDYVFRIFLGLIRGSGKYMLTCGVRSRNVSRRRVIERGYRIGPGICRTPQNSEKRNPTNISLPKFNFYIASE